MPVTPVQTAPPVKPPNTTRHKPNDPAQEVTSSVEKLGRDIVRDGAPVAERVFLVGLSQLPHNIFTASSGKYTFTPQQVAAILTKNPFTGALPRMIITTGTLTIHTEIVNNTREKLGMVGALGLAGVVENCWRIPGLAIMNREVLGKPIPPLNTMFRTFGLTLLPRTLYLAAPKVGKDFAERQGWSDMQIYTTGAALGLTASFTLGRVSEETAIAAQNGQKINISQICRNAFKFSHMTRAGLTAYAAREFCFVGASLLGVTAASASNNESEV
jgi:hypothetical protein